MKITISHLRKIIQEVILSETPLADDGITPPVDLQRIDKGKTSPEMHRANSRFQATPLYKAKAVTTFKEYPQPVYIVPVTVRGVTNSLIRGGARAAVLDPVSTFELLKENGWEYDTNHLLSELGKGATVFLNLAAKLRPGFLPTPWMLHHAIFDTGGEPIFLKKEYNDIFSLILEEHGLTEEQLKRRLTMKSGREGTITEGSDDDMISEIMTQAIVAKNGVQFTYRPTIPGDPQHPRMAAKMDDIKKKIDAMDLKNKFHQAVSGKLIAISNATGANLDIDSFGL